jgi:hypothetical protein
VAVGFARIEGLAALGTSNKITMTQFFGLHDIFAFRANSGFTSKASNRSTTVIALLSVFGSGILIRCPIGLSVCREVPLVYQLTGMFAGVFLGIFCLEEDFAGISKLSEFISSNEILYSSGIKTEHVANFFLV